RVLFRSVWIRYGGMFVRRSSFGAGWAGTFLSYICATQPLQRLANQCDSGSPTWPAAGGAYSAAGGAASLSLASLSGPFGVSPGFGNGAGAGSSETGGWASWPGAFAGVTLGSSR